MDILRYNYCNISGSPWRSVSILWRNATCLTIRWTCRQTRRSNDDDDDDYFKTTKERPRRCRWGSQKAPKTKNGHTIKSGYSLQFNSAIYLFRVIDLLRDHNGNDKSRIAMWLENESQYAELQATEIVNCFCLATILKAGKVQSSDPTIEAVKGLYKVENFAD